MKALINEYAVTFYDETTNSVFLDGDKKRIWTSACRLDQDTQIVTPLEVINAKAGSWLLILDQQEIVLIDDPATVYDIDEKYKKIVEENDSKCKQSELQAEG